VRGGVQSPAGFQLRIALREILPPIWRRFLRSRGEKSTISFKIRVMLIRVNDQWGKMSVVGRA
jgi:hypothetical protein